MLVSHHSRGTMQRAPLSQNRPRSARLSFLVEKNLRTLRQVLRSVEQYDDPAILPNVCSVAQYYRSFLDGLTLCHIVYDSPERDLSRVAALGLMRSLIEEFETSVELNYEGIIWVRMDDAEASGVRECFMESSVSRELQMLSDRVMLLLGLRVRGVAVMNIQEVA